MKVLLLIFSFIWLIINACNSTQYSVNGVCYNCDVTCATCTSSSTTSCQTCPATRFKTSQMSCQCSDGYIQASPVVAACTLLSCSYTCLTCNNTINQCTTCSSSNFRVLVTSNLTCPCIQKYYDSGVAACTACHYSCGSCSGSTSTTCTFCDSTSFRTLSSGKCLCNAGYYDNSLYTCASCLYKCSTCTTGSVCTACGPNRSGSTSCPCVSGYYDDGISLACQICNIACLTCTNGTSCNTCSASNFRILSSLTPLCACMDRYFSTGVALCSACDPRCFTCTSLTVCLTCNMTAYRIYSPSSGFCNCMTGYYQTSTTLQLCSICDSRCLTCSGTSTSCTSCDSTIFRVLSGSSCPCMTGYYQNSFLKCAICDPSCYTCTIGTACTACASGSGKIINSSNLCSCPTTKFLNSITNICQTCTYSCATCASSSPILCTTCPTSSFRTLTNSSCPCNQYYYDSGSATCTACHYSCVTCSSTSRSACLTCNSGAFRMLSAGQCICRQGYYDNLALELCQPCKYNCLTCTNATQCVSCNSTLNRVLSSTTPKDCPCNTYFFQSSLVCVNCFYSCYSCNSLTLCLTCDPLKNRIFNASTNLCDCSPGYYDNFVDQMCLACLPECTTCTNSSMCKTCSGLRFRTLSATNRCPCITGYFDVSGTCTTCMYSCTTCLSPTTCATCNSNAFRVIDSLAQCVCASNYYDDGTNQLCKACSYACLTCTGSAQLCTTCDTTLRSLIAGWCTCPQHFYDNNITVSCIACHYSCSTCIVGINCQTCNASMFRTFDSINQFCNCLDGYYDAGTQKCLACPYQCLTCTNNSQCLTCSPSNFRSLPAQLCTCNLGYYDNGIPLCSPCQYTCKSCTNSTMCSSCQPLANFRALNTQSTCSCLDRYYDDGKNNQLCLPCDYSCLTCINNPTNCQSCTVSSMRTLKVNKCICVQHYFDNLVQLCAPCHYTCSTCNNANNCLTCNSTISRIPSSTNGLCKCNVRFWDDGNNQACKPCQPTCLTCVDLTNCTSCDSARNRVLNSSIDFFNSSSPYCVCLFRFYSLGPNLNCAPCHYSCQVCNGGNRNNCLSCNATSLRYLNVSLSACLCLDGYYDSNSSQICQVCNPACLLCTAGSTSACTKCASTFYILTSTTSCYSTCPSYYHNLLSNMSCMPCSSGCLSCTNSTYCSQCENGKYLYKNLCTATCPAGTYISASSGVCMPCPTGCLTCSGNNQCFTCFDKHYFNPSLGFCFSCNSVCLTCSGPGQMQCLSCASPLFLKNNTCTVLSCASGTFINSVSGCTNCSSVYPNSATCNISAVLSCRANYFLVNGICVNCSGVVGYKYLASGECGEICGDGLLFTLQCDDGNNENGDGCSSNCLIQKGWKCLGSPSVCSLTTQPNIQFQTARKKIGENLVFIVFNIDIPIAVAKSRFSLSISGLSSADFSFQIEQSTTNLSRITMNLTYTKHVQSSSVYLVYSHSRRLQQSRQRLLVTSFSSSFNLATYPPANFYPDSTLDFANNSRSIIAALAATILVLSLIIIPKKMHLHSLSFIYIPTYVYICFGIVPWKYTDWIQYTTQSLNKAATVGGWSFGECGIQYSNYNLSSELVAFSGIILLLYISCWFIYLLLNIFDSYCLKIQQKLKRYQYYLFTITLLFILPITYAVFTALYYFQLKYTADVFNQAISIVLFIFIMFVVIAVWSISYRHLGHSRKTGRVMMAAKQDLIVIPQQSQKRVSEPNIFSMRETGRSEFTNIQNNQKQQFSQQKQLKLTQSKFNKKNQTFLIEDYTLLYDHYKIKIIDGKKYPVQTLARFYLPLHLTKLIIIGVLASTMKNQSLYFIGGLIVIQFIFLVYLIACRPFLSYFTNFRLIITSFLLLATSGVVSIYIYNSQQNNYSYSLQQIAIYLFIGLFGFVLLSLIVQHVLAWKWEIRKKIIQPCLKSVRLMGVRRGDDFDFDQSQSQEIKNISQLRISKNSSFRANQDQVDAFYARMLKKQQIKQDYKRQRMIK